MKLVPMGQGNPKLMKKYVKYRHKKSGKVDDMNWWEWLEKPPHGPQEEKNEFEFIEIIDLDNPPEKESKANEELVIEKDELECPICGFVAKNDKSLRMHKTKKHA